MADTTQYLTLGIDQELFGIDIRNVREILDMRPISKLPHAPAFLLGMIDVRGAGYPILDLRTKLHLPRVEPTEATRIIILDVPLKGRTLGVGVVLRYGRWLHVTREDLRRVEGWLERSGKWTLTFGYFVPGARHFTAIVAGSTGLPARTFGLFAYSGALLWSSTFITLGWYVGARWEAVLARAHRHLVVVGLALVVVIGAYAFAHRWWMGRRKSG